MAKIIKRVGIVFFVLVISCLIMIGCVVATNTANNNGFEKGENQSAMVDSSSKETPVFQELSGATCAAMATNWDTIIQNAKKGNNKVYVKLMNNWTAAITADGVQTSFGSSDVSFFNNDILIPEGMDVTIDLNGKTINRNKTQVSTSGQIFAVAGNLTIMDSSFTNEDIVKYYNVVRNMSTEAIINYLTGLPIGKLTGGWTTNAGGCIWLIKANASVEINGGMILGNKSNAHGGAVYTDQSDSTITMNGGIIIANDANKRGGAIYSTGVESNIILNGGIILGNNALNDGGAINAERTNVQINDIIIANNYCNGNGATIHMVGGEINIYGGLITNNTARSHAGGIYIINYDYNGTNVQATFNMYGGEISYNKSYFGAGLMMYYGAKGNLKDGKIINNHALENGGAVGVYWGSELVMDGGIIANNVVEYHDNENTGGCVLVGHASSMTMNGGEIINNKVLSPWDKQVNGGGLLICNTGTNNVTLNKGVISGNYCEGNGGGVSDTSDSAVIKIGSGMQIHDNIAHGVPSDLRLEQGQKITVTENMSNNNGVSHIGIKLADDYGSRTFTTGYGANNSGNNPSAYFFSNDGAYLATLNGGEVSFEKTIESNVYDFVYIENGKRQNYKENNLTHAVNDYEKSMIVNNGKLILGNIGVNTSINTLIGNINFSRNHIKIYNNKNQLVYDKGNSVAGINASYYDNGREFAVGTGWKIETYTDSGVIIETIYLSVLGDVNGDGRISASDVTYLRQIASDNALYEGLSEEKKLASMVINKGNVTSADAEIVRNVVDKLFAMDLFF